MLLFASSWDRCLAACSVVEASIFWTTSKRVFSLLAFFGPGHINRF